MSNNYEGPKTWKVADLFSGGGGMSFGFHAHPSFEVIAGVDAQVGKPSSGRGTLSCNQTYETNIGVKPFEEDLKTVDGPRLAKILEEKLQGEALDVLLACPPCTGFSRANPLNHLQDDSRNSLVRRVALWVEALQPKLLFMENARELINGNFADHYLGLSQDLRRLGYQVHGSVHFLNEFGLPQKRERALVIAVRDGLPMHTLEELWRGYTVSEKATTVRTAIGDMPAIGAGEQHPDDSMHVSPKLLKPASRRRMHLMPHNGGSWADLRDHPDAKEILTPAMLRYIEQRKFGSHPDIYGRLWWDRPAVTVKRECAHNGNGRYSHPEQDRLLTVREMATIQGFPKNYRFASKALSNMYRHIGDAVPPLISFQLAWVAHWILSGEKPDIHDVILPGTHLSTKDIEIAPHSPVQTSFGFDTSVDAISTR